MRHPGPSFTLLAGVVLAGGIGIADVASKTGAPVAGSADATTTTPPSIAVSARDGHAIAYVCDGKKIEAWLQGVTVDGKLDLRGAPNASLTGSFDATSATGSVTAAGRTYRFTVPVAKKPAGLYRATPKVKGKPAKAGWIVQSDGSQVGLLTTEEGTAAAPVLDPAAGTATVDGVPVTAEPISGVAGTGKFR
jgi:serine/threonine-protein kinase